MARKEFLSERNRRHARIADAQAVLDDWVPSRTSTQPPAPGDRPRNECPALAAVNRAVAAALSEVEAAAPDPTAPAGPLGASRLLDQRGKVSVAGFPYRIGASCETPGGRLFGGRLFGGRHRPDLGCTVLRSFAPRQAADPWELVARNELGTIRLAVGPISIGMDRYQLLAGHRLEW
jgi:hypothetical protein